MRFDLDRNEGARRIIAAKTSLFGDGLDFDEGLARMSPFRRRKALSYRFAKDRKLSLLAGLLLDELLCERGLRERDMTYAVDACGKPALRGFPDLHFSLAHSGEMALAALDRAPIGVDVERLSGFPHDVADPYGWTEMESIGKALGCGVGPFVDGDADPIAQGMRVEHVQLGDYLVCIAVPAPGSPFPATLLKNPKRKEPGHGDRANG